MTSWQRLSLRIGTFGFLKEYRPGDPYITQYLVGPIMNLTEEQVNQEVYPVATYVGLVQIIFVFLLTDLLCYKPIIVLNALSGVIAQSIPIWCRGLFAMQIMEVFYATMIACEVAYYTYLYANVDKKYYQKVTSHMRAASLTGRFTSSVSAQLLISLEILTIADLNYLTLSGMICALICALTLPSMNYSLYFHRKSSPGRYWSQNSRETFNTDGPLLVVTTTSKCMQVMKYLWIDFKHAYTNPYVLKWCIWVALATCGFDQMMTYVQILWVEIGGKHSVTYNGAVEAIYTLSSATSAILFGLLNINWQRYGDTMVGVLTTLQGLVLIVSAVTNFMVVAYAAYVIFGILYNVMLVIVNSEIAKNVKEDSYGLIFGVNIFVSLVIQTILTFTVAAEGGLTMSITHQFFIYGGYFIVIGAIFLIKSIFTVFAPKNESPEPNR